METLAQIFEKHKTPHQDGGDKGDVHSYIPVYEKLFRPLRFTTGHILEIGVRYGSSIRMWEEYFPYAQIHGLDVLKECEQYQSNRTRIHIVDAASPAAYAQLNKYKFSIIIDDGSHKITDQIGAFKILFPLLYSSGYYIIEDILHFDRDIDAYKELYSNLQIYDLRDIKGRGDDILLVYQK